ncbi:MAG: hypothetical protein ACK55Z_08850, partial [bacterium]
MVQRQVEYGTCRSRPQRRTPPKQLRIRFVINLRGFLFVLLEAKWLCSCTEEFLGAQDFVRLCGAASPLDRAKLLEGRLPGA